MYAVIKTGGKQYRVKAGDMLIVEKLLGEPGAKVAFDQVLMLGDGAGVTIGAPLVADAVVSATLVETRKGEKIKVFKKTRRKGYRRTGGHRQIESVLRVTAIVGDGKSETWDGEVELTTRAEINARARNLAPRVAAEITTTVDAESQAKSAKSKAPAKTAPEAEVEAVAVEAAARAAVAEAPAKKKAAPKAEGEAAPAKKPAAKKAKPAVGDDA
jgi:large subunit ribosomal protein L21